ncbi:MAG: pyruvate ferredoxin oxidoreductase [Chloroflexi bacterium]|nr:pyruvate ferredoxin oxidoreductase [Chloroflexota bacterium]
MALDGNGAVAEAMRQINPDVVPAYPITPSTAIPQAFAQYMADGVVDTEFVPVESEHSAMSACIGASAAGGRVMTATSANGLALMWEMLYIAASYRLPIVMADVSRALSGPVNIHCDHSDSMGARDTGWIHLFSETAQEAYENTLQAVRIGEHMDVRLPVMVMQDGFITSHTMERVTIYDDASVKTFIGSYTPYYPLLDIDHPVTYGPLDLTDYYFEHKRAQIEGMRNAKHVILDVGAEFGRTFGRTYGLFDTYQMDDADVAIVVMASTAGTARYAMNALRARGVRAGLIKPRVFRPFPAQELCDALRNVKAVAVMDRSVSFGAMNNGGPLWLEMLAAAQLHKLHIPIVDYVYGLGGREIKPSQIENVYQDLATIAETGEFAQPVTYLGVRGEEDHQSAVQGALLAA